MIVSRACGIVPCVANLRDVALRLLRVLTVVVHPADADRCARRGVVGHFALVAVAGDVLAVAVPTRRGVRLRRHRVLDTVLSEGRALREHVVGFD